VPGLPAKGGGGWFILADGLNHCISVHPWDYALSCGSDSPHIGGMAKTPDPPKQPGKPPKSKVPKSKAPKSKAHRPEVQPIGPALADLLNPAINRGNAGLGSGTGLQPPPDNSWDRRSGGEAAAHRARASTRGKSDATAKRDATGSPSPGGGESHVEDMRGGVTGSSTPPLGRRQSTTTHNGGG
jgi:excinuclease ABC subunit B